MAQVEQQEKQPFCKFTHRGRDPDQLQALRAADAAPQGQEEVAAKPRPAEEAHLMLKRQRKAKKETQLTGKPKAVKTHLWDLIILPETVGSMLGMYNGKTFNQVEIKPEMTGHYLCQFSISYNPVKHGWPGIGTTHSYR